VNQLLAVGKQSGEGRAGVGSAIGQEFAVKTNAFATVIVIKSIIWLVGHPSSFLAAPTALIIRGRVEGEFKFPLYTDGQVSAGRWLTAALLVAAPTSLAAQAKPDWAAIRQVCREGRS
jgi:hypothetical protein